MKEIDQVSINPRPRGKAGKFFHGVCPWDKSTRQNGKRSGYQDRHCDTCETVFIHPCPVCEQGRIQNSVGKNHGTGEYGCDMCGRIFT